MFMKMDTQKAEFTQSFSQDNVIAQKKKMQIVERPAQKDGYINFIVYKSQKKAVLFPMSWCIQIKHPL